AERLGLDEEAVDVLAQLSEQVPWRQEVWLRLGLAQLRTSDGGEGARNAILGRGSLDRAARGEDPKLAREALLALADHDIAHGEVARAERWLRRLPKRPTDPELALREGECAWSRGRLDEARAALARVQGLDTEATPPLGSGAPRLIGRLRLLEARVAAARQGDEVGDHPLRKALGAMLLDAPGADDLVIDELARCHDAALVDETRKALAVLERPLDGRWGAAFALAEGRREDARRALLGAAAEGDADAAELLLRQALVWRDEEALGAVATHHPDRFPRGLRPLLNAFETSDLAVQLDEAERVRATGEAAAWAEQRRAEVVAAWLPPGQSADWPAVFEQLQRAARALHASDLVRRLDDLERERKRPLNLAVVGEFNAGKSTFLNALLGTDVAPTGIRPTTASLHRVAWAPDAYAHIEVVEGEDRVVGHERLKDLLAELQDARRSLGEVKIFAPYERLRQVEILDTPGFNAPDKTHGAHARRGIAEAHLIVWLLDGNAPLKDSERAILREAVVDAAIPLIVLLNKRDRVGEEAIAQVLDYVTTALAEQELPTLAAPVAFSARLALEGRLHDDASRLESSRWTEVEAVLEEVLGQRDALRERAYRRKAKSIATELTARAGDAYARDADEEQARTAQLGMRREVAAWWQADRTRIARNVLETLKPALEAYDQDARPIAALDEARRSAPEVRGYLVERGLFRISQPLQTAIVQVTDDRGLTPGIDRELLARTTEAVIAGTVATHEGATLPARTLQTAAETVLNLSATEMSSELADDGSDTLPSARLLRRLRLLGEALSTPGG
ncbi:MAG: dynamin family protein, partial [Myxococcota bacterium]